MKMKLSMREKNSVLFFCDIKNVKSTHFNCIMKRYVINYQFHDMKGKASCHMGDDIGKINGTNTTPCYVSLLTTKKSVKKLMEIEMKIEFFVC